MATMIDSFVYNVEIKKGKRFRYCEDGLSEKAADRLVDDLIAGGEHREIRVQRVDCLSQEETTVRSEGSRDPNLLRRAA